MRVGMPLLVGVEWLLWARLVGLRPGHQVPPHEPSQSAWLSLQNGAVL